MAKELIRSFGGKYLGSIETKPNGDVVVTSWGGKIIATYSKKENVTRNFYGVKIANGNVAAGFLLKGII